MDFLCCIWSADTPGCASWLWCCALLNLFYVEEMKNTSKGIGCFTWYIFRWLCPARVLAFGGAHYLDTFVSCEARQPVNESPLSSPPPF